MKREQFLQTLVSLPFGMGTFLAHQMQRGEMASRYLLNKFYVAGFQYYNGPACITNIEHGKRLELKVDPSNKYDKFAVAIYRNEKILGHIPRTDNKHISRLLQQDVDLLCEVVEVNPDQETWKMLKVHIYL